MNVFQYMPAEENVDTFLKTRRVLLNDVFVGTIRESIFREHQFFDAQGVPQGTRFDSFDDCRRFIEGRQ